jgi:hypothetical protein
VVVVQVGPVSAGQLKLGCTCNHSCSGYVLITLRVSLLDAHMISEPDDPQVDQVSCEDVL